MNILYFIWEIQKLPYFNINCDEEKKFEILTQNVNQTKCFLNKNDPNKFLIYLKTIIKRE